MHRLAAQRLIEALVMLLGQRGGHSVGRVQAGERRGGINSRILPAHKSLPAHLLQVWEFEIGPGLDPLGDPVTIFIRAVLAEALAVRVDYAHQTIIEVDQVVLVYQTDVVHPMAVDISQDQIQILLVTKHDVGKDIQTELSEIDRPASHLFDLGPFLFIYASGLPPGDRCAGVHLTATMI